MTVACTSRYRLINLDNNSLPWYIALKEDEKSITAKTSITMILSPPLLFMLSNFQLYIYTFLSTSFFYLLKKRSPFKAHLFGATSNERMRGVRVSADKLPTRWSVSVTEHLLDMFIVRLNKVLPGFTSGTDLQRHWHVTHMQIRSVEDVGKTIGLKNSHTALHIYTKKLYKINS